MALPRYASKGAISFLGHYVRRRLFSHTIVLLAVLARTFVHSIVLTLVLVAIVILQQYVVPGVIPATAENSPGAAH